MQEGRHISYPDVVVSCHPFDLRGNNLIIRQPRLIVEVLSKSTAHKDRGDKWRFGYLEDSVLPFRHLGTVTNGGFVMDETTIMTVGEAKNLYDNALGDIMQ